MVHSATTCTISHHCMQVTSDWINVTEHTLSTFPVFTAWYSRCIPILPAPNHTNACASAPDTIILHFCQLKQYLPKADRLSTISHVRTSHLNLEPVASNSFRQVQPKQTSDWATASLQSYRIFAFSSKAVHLEPRQLPGPAVPGLPCHVPEAPMGRRGCKGPFERLLHGTSSATHCPPGCLCTRKPHDWL